MLMYMCKHQPGGNHLHAQLHVRPARQMACTHWHMCRIPLLANASEPGIVHICTVVNGTSTGGCGWYHIVASTACSIGCIQVEPGCKSLREGIHCTTLL